MNIFSNKSTQFNLSIVMHIMRAFAILSVISAHSVSAQNETKWDFITFQLLNAFGIFGVPVFFISAGYFFFNNKRKTYPSFLLHKIKPLFVPWVFLTTLVYLYVALRKDGLNFKDYTYFLIGIKNYTYFLSILLLYFLVFLKVNFTRTLLLVLGSISIVSLILTTNAVILFNPYINPFNWLIYFVIGIAVSKFQLLEKIALVSQKYLIIYFALFVVCNFIIVILEMKVNYWQPIGYFYILISFMMFLGFSTKFKFKLQQFTTIGENSMTIYLSHSLFAGSIVFLTEKLNLWYLYLLRPILILVLVLLMILIVKRLAAYFKVERIIYPLMGLPLKN